MSAGQSSCPERTPVFPSSSLYPHKVQTQQSTPSTHLWPDLRAGCPDVPDQKTRRRREVVARKHCSHLQPLLLSSLQFPEDPQS